jgi:hypothetical protein
MMTLCRHLKTSLKKAGPVVGSGRNQWLIATGRCVFCIDVFTKNSGLIPVVSGHTRRKSYWIVL